MTEVSTSSPNIARSGDVAMPPSAGNVVTVVSTSSPNIARSGDKTNKISKVAVEEMITDEGRALHCLLIVHQYIPAAYSLSGQPDL
jgi:hypothetical protein